MEELWTVRCFEGTGERWEEDVRLSEQDMVGLLRLLLCQNLAHHEIIAAVTGDRADLLEVRQEGNRMYTAANNLLHYTAQKTPRP